MGVKIPEEIRFNADGLIPAIIQDAASGEVLMLAYMNRESLLRTLATGETWFYSRSRQELWHKGATSGHRQYVVDASYDCDADALLFKVQQVGVACHEGEFSCFHNPLSLQVSTPKQPVKEKLDKKTDKETSLSETNNHEINDGEKSVQGSRNLTSILDEVFEVIKQRQKDRPEGSYTTYLFNNGLDKILKKIGEEAAETIIASKNDSQRELIYEMADLYYHTLVLLAYHGLTPNDLAGELSARR
ncbi:MAG: phosphoribosyl-AMP cyclohydrolase / phosphoribosyl-ATP pyrophosphohydrolase [Clostridia bacterium]|nr:phosphoribosyl-AMP cyclohydrolase / phosphoribosyl-ATP pyrophosphohydrolase [Clostridia bacterium]